MANLLATIDLTSAQTPGTSYELVTGLTATVAIVGTGSVVLLLAQVPITEGGANDSSLSFQFTVDGSAANSPIMVGFIDRGNEDEQQGIRLSWAVTGLSTGNHTFTVEVKKRTGGTPTIDTRPRSFQVIEFDSDATILINQKTTAANSSTSSWANMTDLSATVTPASGSLLLFLFNAFSDDGTGGDLRAEFRFILDGTQDGPYGMVSIDASNEMDGVSMMWAETGHANTSQSIAVQWRTVNGNVPMDPFQLRTFQVIEITADFSLGIDVLVTSAQTAPTNYADMTSMTGAITPDSTDSVVLWLGVGVVAANSDRHAELRMADGGTLEGAELTTWTDSTSLVTSWSLSRAKTGLSGSHTFSLQWKNNGTAAATDTGRDRSFQVIDFKAAASGIDYDETGKTMTITSTITATDQRIMHGSIVITSSLVATDQLDANEALALTIASTLVATDQLDANELPDLTIVNTVVGTDQLDANEALAFTIVSTITATDISVFIEALSVSIASTLAATDQLDANEARTFTIVNTVVGTDQLDANEVVAITIISTISETDAQNYIEAVSIAIAATIAETDILSAVEAQGITVVSSLVVSDQLDMNEGITLLIVSTISGTSLQSGGGAPLLSLWSEGIFQVGIPVDTDDV